MYLFPAACRNRCECIYTPTMWDK